MRNTILKLLNEETEIHAKKVQKPQKLNYKSMQQRFKSHKNSIKSKLIKHMSNALIN